jgi:hypothetical protein
MILALIVSLLTPLLIGYFLVCLIWPERPPWHHMIKCCLAVGVGYGITSCHFFLLTLAGVSSEVSFVSELVVGVALGVAFIFSARRRLPAAARGLPSAQPSASTLERVLRVAFLCGLALALAAFVMLTLREPHGGDADNWDSWAQWNLRARLIHRLGAQWPAAFFFQQGRLYTPHPDYPLLLPLSVARCWDYAGSELTVVPSVLALLFTFAVVGLIFSALCAARGRAQGYLGALALLGLPAFVEIGAWQYADMPLALFILMTFALFCFHDRSSHGHRGLLFLAGVSTGLAAWTKNEGWLFLIAVVIARRFAVGAGGWRLYLGQMSRYSIGLLPVLAVVLFFKLHFAAANDLVSGISFSSTLWLLLDPSRYLLIIRISAEQVLNSTGWIASPWALVPYALLRGVKPEEEDKSGVSTLAVSLALLLTGYFFVYVVTPLDLSWHLRTSVLRLLLHLWPGIVLTYFLVVNAVGGQPRRRVAEGQSILTSRRAFISRFSRSWSSGKLFG